MDKLINFELTSWLDNRLLQMNHNQYANSAYVPQSKKEWEECRQETVSRLALAAGLIPLPDFPDFSPKVWGHAEHDGVIIAKVSFETVPGLICTGSLFLPKDTSKKVPAILCPYGHWPKGRFHQNDRGDIPARCIRFAQLGMAAFCYDMLGKCDNNQLMHYPPLDQERLAELYGATPFALQTWNSMRALDFVCGLPEIDDSRIGCTGASGGGSQTWIITALDPRIKVFSPVCMLSSHFQGGCICEEGPMLRLNGLTSFDVVSACAPRPCLLPSVTRDWTNRVPDYEFPALKKIYTMLGAPDNIANFHSDYPHNYNQFTREHVYAWFAHHLLKQPLKKTIPEGTLAPLPLELLAHSLPQTEPTPETHRAALDKIRRFTVKDDLGFTTDKADYNAEHEEKRDLLNFIMNADSTCRDIVWNVSVTPWWDLPDNGGHAWGRLVSRRDIGDIIPAVMVTPPDGVQSKNAVLLIAPEGQAVFFDSPEQNEILTTVLKSRTSACTMEYLGTGETAKMPEQSPNHPYMNRPEFYAFNQSLFSMRVQDLITSVRMLLENGFASVTLVAYGEAARVAAFAAPLAEGVKHAILDLKDVHDDDASWLKAESFQPLVYRIGGLKGALSLIAPARLTVCNADEDISAFLSDLGKTLNTSSITVSKDPLCTLLARSLKSR